MIEWFDRIREFFRENPRMWIVAGAALVIGFGTLWFSFGGFDFGTSRFFAATDEGNTNTEGNGNNGGACSVTFRSCSGTDVFEHYSNCSGKVVQQCSNGCDPGNSQNTAAFCVPSSSVAPGSTPTASTNPSGDCTLSGGLWYCKSLSCGLAGNGSNPPVGPATSIDVSQFRTVCDDVEVPNNPQVGCKIFMDATPKLGSQEGYPPRDPAWSCTGSAAIEETEGRYCYTPFAKATAPGPVTCCTNTGLSGDCVSFTVVARIGGTGGTGGTPAAALLRVTCSTTGASLAWNIPARANSNTIQRMVPGGSWVDIFGDASLARTSFIDTPQATGTQWRHKSGANVASNVVTCSGTVVSSTPTPTVVQGPPVQCTPTRQTVDLNQTARLQATGGNNVYTWNITQGGSLEEGGNQYIGVSYRTVGEKTLRLNGGGTSALCTITVVDSSLPVPSGNVPVPSGGVTPTASPIGGGSSILSVEKTAQNTTTSDPVERSAITVFPGQTAQFRIRITNNGTATVSGVRVIDALPAGLSVTEGSTTVNGQPIASDAITAGGIALDPLNPGSSVIIEWSAIADRTEVIVSGPNVSSPTARVTAGGIADVLAQMSVTVYGSGATSQAGGVPTGPGGTLLGALMTAAILTLLYAGYTRSPSYRHRDADSISRDQGPMDFRS